MKLSKSKYIHMLFMIALMFGISFCPPFGQITPYGMKAWVLSLGIIWLDSV